MIRVKALLPHMPHVGHVVAGDEYEVERDVAEARAKNGTVKILTDAPEKTPAPAEKPKSGGKK